MDDADASDWVRVRSGDPAALGALFDRHESRLFRQACRLLTSREDAKDAVTIAFFELWRKRASVRLLDGSPLPWMLNAVSHCSRNRMWFSYVVTWSPDGKSLLALSWEQLEVAADARGAGAALITAPRHTVPVDDAAQREIL